jgi:hypothetical protein
MPLQYSIIVLCENKRLLHDIFHIGPGISPRLPYQARQRSWRADMSANQFLYLLTMYVYDVYPAMPKSPKQLPNCMKRAETILVLIVFNGVRLCLRS